jgi:hypothetical protein
LWKVQNLFYRLLAQYEAQEKAANEGDDAARRWIAHFRDIGHLLRIKLAAEPPADQERQRTAKIKT